MSVSLISYLKGEEPPGTACHFASLNLGEYRDVKTRQFQSFLRASSLTSSMIFTPIMTQLRQIVINQELQTWNISMETSQWKALYQWRESKRQFKELPRRLRFGFTNAQLTSTAEGGGAMEKPIFSDDGSSGQKTHSDNVSRKAFKRYSICSDWKNCESAGDKEYLMTYHEGRFLRGRNFNVFRARGEF